MHSDVGLLVFLPLSCAGDVDLSLKLFVVSEKVIWKYCSDVLRIQYSYTKKTIGNEQNIKKRKKKTIFKS